jgi:hypothetical protein
MTLAASPPLPVRASIITAAAAAGRDKGCDVTATPGGGPRCVPARAVMRRPTIPALGSPGKTLAMPLADVPCGTDLGALAS